MHSSNLIALLILFVLAAGAGAEDRAKTPPARENVAPQMATQGSFTQWRGAERDGHIGSFTAPETWPEKLRLMWKVPVGSGHSTPLVDGGRIYLHHREDEHEVVSAFDLADGRRLWESKYPAPYKPNQHALGHGKGPFSTPTLKDGRLYTLGISGILSAFDTATGDLLWRQDHSAEVDTSGLFYGTASSPLAVEGLLIAQVGDDTGGTMLALDAVSGEKRWAFEGPGPGYASPRLTELQGVRQIVTMTSDEVVGVDFADGRLLWRRPFPDKWKENIVMPVVYNGSLILADVENGTFSTRVKKKGSEWHLEEIWRRDGLTQFMSSPVLDGDVLYGMSDKKKGHFFALDARTGEEYWSTDGRQGQNAIVLAAGDHLVFLTESAELTFARKTPETYNEVATYEVADGATWAHPVLLGSRVLIKSASHLYLWAL